MRAAIYVTLIFAACASAGHAQNNNRDARKITVNEFLEIISAHPDIAKDAARTDAAQAEVDVAKIMPDPSLTLGNLSGDISGINMPHQWFVGLDYTIEAGGKRRHRVLYAKALVDQAKAQHELFAAEFKRDGLLLYQRCWMLERQLDELEQYDSLLSVTRVDDSLQVFKRRIDKSENGLKLDALRRRYNESLERLNDLVAHVVGNGWVLPFEAVWTESDGPLVKMGEEHPVMKLNRVETRLAAEELLVSESNRVPDISFSLGNSFITRATNPEAPSPRYNAITATLSIPLKLSNIRGAEKKRDSYKMEQAAHDEASAAEMLQQEFEVATDDVDHISRELRSIAGLIAMERQFIKTIPANEALMLMNEWRQLNAYCALRWEKFDQLAQKKAELYFLTGGRLNNTHSLTGSPR
ncbi:TolC family protein [Fulvivirgaceae bacterium PWU4]|uniref:TolC family protein n=1 Tax=Chryseosolibacter histidini TaxID=2782349 RepID=A0AAP2DSF6_9BACT|nr:TolC family protein [Chryseosolibacter histidini]MBT1700654.1 TolC family protein [Chryseosolibacter histidini]